MVFGAWKRLTRSTAPSTATLTMLLSSFGRGFYASHNLVSKISVNGDTASQFDERRPNLLVLSLQSILN